MQVREQQLIFSPDLVYAINHEVFDSSGRRLIVETIREGLMQVVSEEIDETALVTLLGLASCGIQQVGQSEQLANDLGLQTSRHLTNIPGQAIGIMDGIIEDPYKNVARLSEDLSCHTTDFSPFQEVELFMASAVGGFVGLGCSAKTASSFFTGARRQFEHEILSAQFSYLRSKGVFFALGG